ncbi:hypothetical protein Caka_0871 [Coraliomargarita akajimensis DSM 45221]|uniref:Uncharacterized protein n=1 Tax=Coraliomargarita akajimensis (strain DSM 45221 / IAM 15411 / JCM 23193 / KCTC 12865 / 04OKA010-24) TaxID=583355 RepID=D5EQC6_CORAD|nr:hypothetical protein Caka_0871 [Coraliomargarita akajimensis DSM 45221]
MSNLILLKGESDFASNLGLRPIGLESLPRIYHRSYRYHYPSSDPTSLWSVELLDGKSFDCLVTSAKDQVDEGLFQKSLLYRFLAQALLNVDELIIWYGADYKEPIYLDSLEMFWAEIEDGIKSVTSEIYVKYKQRRNT